MGIIASVVSQVEKGGDPVLLIGASLLLVY